MMTIKLIQHKAVDEKKQSDLYPTIHLYEGDEVWHKLIEFKDREDFIKKYNDLTEDLPVISVIGIPDDYWKEKEIDPNAFVSLYYTNDHKVPSCLILQNLTIYIMQGGQTVDKIHC